MEGWITDDVLMTEREEPASDILAGLFGDDPKDVFDQLMDILGDDEDVEDGDEDLS
jgi:hypothetical protein